MKLLFVHDHPFYVEGQVVYSGGGLPENGWQKYLDNFDEVTVFARRSHNLKDKKVISSRSGVVFVLTEEYNRSIDALLNSKVLNDELKPLIAKNDVVLARLPSVLGFFAGRLTTALKGKLWVEQVGNAREAMSSHGSIVGKLVAPVFERINKSITRNASFVSYVTENKLQLDYPAKSSAITTSLSNVLINNILSVNQLNMDRFNGEKFNIGIIGGFDVKYKGQDILLKAIATLPEHIKGSVSLFFVGKGDFSWVVDLAGKLDLLQQVKFIGSLQAGDEINAFLEKLSLYVQPSLTEGMPRATIEAMSKGCPVIGSNVGGIPDVVNKKFVHKKGDVKQLSSHIIFLFNNRSVLIQEAMDSLAKAQPYIIQKLNERRSRFYIEMNKICSDSVCK